MKTVTIVIQPGDKREAELRHFVQTEFPDVSGIEIREDDLAGTPRAIRLLHATYELELMGIDSAIFRYFNE